MVARKNWTAEMLKIDDRKRLSLTERASALQDAACMAPMTAG
jgi:hypothetical protein